MRRWICVSCLGWILFTTYLSANSINLFNDSQYTLKAIVYDAGGMMLGEFILNSRDATVWSNDQQNFGSQAMYASQTPYTVNWLCMGGAPYGSCNNVAAGSLVTAQGCGGVQECTPEGQGTSQQAASRVKTRDVQSVEKEIVVGNRTP